MPTTFLVSCVERTSKVLSTLIGDLDVGERERRQRVALDRRARLRSANFVGDALNRNSQNVSSPVICGGTMPSTRYGVWLMSGVTAACGAPRAPGCGASSTRPARARASPTALCLRHGRLRVGDGLIGLRQRRLRFCERLVRCGRRRRRRHVAQDGGRAERLDHVIAAIATAAPAATAGRGLDRRATGQPRDELPFTSRPRKSSWLAARFTMP